MTQAPSDFEDPGQSVERTLLSWRRTALLIGVASVLSARLLADAVGPVIFAVGLLGVALAIAAHGNASARYRQSQIPVGSGHRVAIASPRRLATMSAAVVTLAVLALALVVTLQP
jgi:uncharacterized membrane protein YidH (DUF202 family)